MVDPVLTPLVVAGAAWLGKALTSEPVTEAATSVATNLASSQMLDPVCRRVRGALGARMSGADGSLPRNHDVERAVRTAQMQANRALIADFAERASARNRPSDISFAKRAAAWVEAEYSAIGRLEVSDAVRTATIAAIDASLSDRDAVTDDGALRDQAQAATEAALAELEAATGGPAPDVFRARFLSTDAAQRSWFDAFGAFLTEQVKANDAFRSILTAARLAEIGAGVRRIEDMADQWTTVAETLRRTADEQLALLRGIKEDTSAIRETLDDPDYGLKALHEQIQALAIARGGSPADVEALRAERDQLKAHGEIKDRAYEGFLAILREQPIPPEQWAAQLATFAERYQALLAESRTRTNLPPDLEAERRRAETAIEAGDLDGADAILAVLSDRMAEQREQAGREEAKICARRAEIARTQLRYYDAAALFGQAAVAEPQTDLDAVWGRLMDQASVLYNQGHEFGDNAACEQAITIYRRALVLRARERAALEWAGTQNNLGIALRALGERESGTARLYEAVEAHRAALKEQTRERVPLDWAGSQNNLGVALKAIGERESGTARLEEAVVAYRAALEEWTRERVPLDWAGGQNNLGVALKAIGERESGTARLEEAVVAYREALQERTRERVPLDWAATQSNLGSALQVLGRRESGTARLDEAVVAYHEALQEQTRERIPMAWAATQTNLGNVLCALGERESGTLRLNEAMVAYRQALLVWTRERVPLSWAGIQNNLGNILQVLGERESGTVRLEEAVAAYRAALLEWTRERVPLDWAMTQNNLGNALQVLGERESDMARLEEAEEAYQAALAERTRDRVPLDWAVMRKNQAALFDLLHDHTGDHSRLDQAIEAASDALEMFESAGADYQIGLARTLLNRLLAKRDGSS